MFGGLGVLHCYNHCKHWSFLRSEVLQRCYKGVTGRYTGGVESKVQGIATEANKDNKGGAEKAESGKRKIFSPPPGGRKLSVPTVPTVPRPVNIGDFEGSIRPSIRPNVPPAVPTSHGGSLESGV